MSRIKKLGRSPLRMPDGEKLSYHGVQIRKGDSGHLFCYRVRRPDGKWKSESFLLFDSTLTPREYWDRAKEYGRTRRPVLLSNGASSTRTATSDGVLVRDVLDRWLEHKRVQTDTRPATLDSYRRDLEKHFGETLLAMPVANVTPAAVTDAQHAAFLRDGARVVSARTWNKLTTYLSMVFEWARRQKLVTENPVTEDHRIKSTKEEKARRRAVGQAMPTDEQEAAFIRAAEESENSTSASRALAVGLLTGLRLQELAHLRVRDVTLEAGLEDLEVAADHHDVKTDAAERFVPLTREAAQLVRAQLAALAPLGLDGKDAWLFPVLARREGSKANVGDRLNAGTLRRCMRSLAAKAGWPPLPPRAVVHFLRHVARSRWAAAGLTTEQIDRAIGHAAEGVRENYTHAKRRELFAAFRRVLDGETVRPVVARKTA